MTKVFVALTWEPAFMTPDLLCAVFDTEERAWNHLLPEGVTSEEFYDLRRALSEYTSVYGDEDNVAPDLVSEFFEDDEEPNDDYAEDYKAWNERMVRRALLMDILPDARVFEMDTESKDPWTMVIGQGSFM